MRVDRHPHRVVAMNGSAQNPVLVPFDADNYYLINYPTSEVTTLPRYTNLFIIIIIFFYFFLTPVLNSRGIIIIIIRNAANRVLIHFALFY